MESQGRMAEEMKKRLMIKLNEFRAPFLVVDIFISFNIFEFNSA